MDSFVRYMKDPLTWIDKCVPLKKLALVGDSVLSLVLRLELTNAPKYNWERLKDRNVSYNPGFGPLDRLLSPSNKFLSSLYEHISFPCSRYINEAYPHERGTVIEAFIGAVFIDSGYSVGKTSQVFFSMFGYQLDQFMRRELGTSLKYSVT